MLNKMLLEWSEGSVLLVTLLLSTGACHLERGNDATQRVYVHQQQPAIWIKTFGFKTLLSVELSFK